MSNARGIRRVMLAALTLLSLLLPGSAAAVSSNVLVSATVASATSMTPACASGGAATSFGLLFPGDTVVTGSDCTITFGSSNDSSMLRVSQTDQTGSSMYLPATGSLDTGFAGGGVSMQNGWGAGDMEGRGTAVQLDGKIIQTAYVDAASDDFTATRFLVDGTPDPAWGGGTGTVNIPVGAGQDDSYAVAVQPDGKVILAGFSYGGGVTGNDFAVARLLANGTPDPSFGTGGVMTVSLSASTDFVNYLLVLPSGKILAGGASFDSPNSQFDTALVRLNANGSLDSTFGTGGVVIAPVAPARNDVASRMTALSDGSVLIVGSLSDGDYAGVGFTFLDGYLMHLREDGSRDPLFAGAGLVMLNINTFDVATDVQTLPNGQIVVSGYTKPGATVDTVLWRFNADGTPDVTFGGGSGRVVVSVLAGDERPYSLLQQGDGKLITAGRSGTGGGATQGTYVARFDATGVLDPTFGTAGVYSTIVGTGGNMNIEAHLSDGAIVLGGAANNGTNIKPFIMRLGSIVIADYINGSTDWDQGSAMFGMCLRAVSAPAITDVSTWSPDGTCTKSDGAWWQAIPRHMNLSGAKTTFSPTATATAAASFRFGIRVANSQKPGTYLAPITFTVIAPAV